MRLVSNYYFLHLLRHWDVNGHVNRIVLVLIGEFETFAVGFIIYETKKDCLKILNLAVSPQYTRQGFGSVLINAMVLKLAGSKKSLEIIVRESNLQAQLFLRSLNFRAIQILRRYMKDTHEDGYLMRHCPVLEFPQYDLSNRIFFPLESY